MPPLAKYSAQEMPQMASILAGNSIGVTEWEPCATEDCPYHDSPQIVFRGNESEGRRAVEIGLENGFLIIAAIYEISVGRRGIVENSARWRMFFSPI